MNNIIAKKILVTGGAGFVGTNLINLHIKKKQNIRLLVLIIILRDQKKIILKIRRVSYIKGDTKNISQIIKSSKNI